jgi:3-hydroxy acid dehydrogenase/malonic semialdehyde reductase
MTTPAPPPVPTVLVTGATAGFGAACARRFAAHGARLVLVGRREDRLRAMEESLAVPVHAITLDVRDRVAVARAFSSLPAEFSAVDVLVNNAGLALGLDKAPTANLDDWDVMVDTNVKGLMYCTRAILPGMVERGRGHVVNLGSVAGTYPYLGGNVYGGTKAFVHQFSMALRSELLGTSIRVTCIEPGMAQTEFSTVRFHGDQAKGDAVYAGVTALSADDVAEAVHWCATRPPHVNINVVELMPTQQAFGGFSVHRQG